MTKKLLPKPVQSSNVTDKDGKPTSYHYRWMDGVNQAVTTLDAGLTSTNSDVATINTSISNINTSLTSLTNTVNGLTGLTRGTAIVGADTPNKTFTGIPSWVKQVTVVFDAVSIKWTSDYIWLQLGAGSIQTTGYNSRSAIVETGAAVTNINTSAFVITNLITNAIPFYGSVTLTNITGNTWVSVGTIGLFNNGTLDRLHTTTGRVALSNKLDRINLTTPNSGTSSTSTNITGGTMNILYQ